MANFKPLPPLAELQKAFDYDPETGAILRNGKPAGWLKEDGYLLVSYKNKKFRQHRIAYYLGTTVDPGSLDVDHVDGNRSNNALHNLRLATRQQNKRNSKQTKGYTYRRGRWQAQITLDGSCKYLGAYKTKEEAAAAYAKAAQKYFGCFYRDATV
jgi:hypothetical protein